jgi:Clp amino terminal domain, pathogenicity island component
MQSSLNRLAIAVTAGWVSAVVILTTLGVLTRDAAGGLVVAEVGLCVLFTITASFILERRQQIRLFRERNGCCLKCGYDLRANTDRCSECGEPIRCEPTELPTTPAVDRILHRARVLAEGANADCMGSEHVLLAFFSEPESAGTCALAAMGVTEDDLRQEMSYLLGWEFAPRFDMVQSPLP